MIIRFSCRVAFTIFFSCEVSHLQSQESSDVLQFGKIQEGFRSSIDLITSIRVAYKCRPLSAVGAAGTKFEFTGTKSKFYFSKTPLPVPRQKHSASQVDNLKTRLLDDEVNQKIYCNSSDRVEVNLSGFEASITLPNPLENSLGVENPWVLAGVYVTAEPIYTWANLFGAESVQSITKESLDGVSVLKVQTALLPIKDFPVKCTVYFEPGANFLVKRYVTELKLENTFGVKWLHVCSFDCAEFLEVKPGFYFPKRTQNRSFSKFEDGRPNLIFYDISTEFSLVEINNDVPNETFEYKIPNGMLVNDLRKMISYRTGPDGKPVGVPSMLDRSSDSSMVNNGWKARRITMGLCFASFLIVTYVFFRYVKVR